MVRGWGIKALFKRKITGFLKAIFPVGIIYNSPRVAVTSNQIVATGASSDKVNIVSILPEDVREEPPPRIYNYRVSARFAKYFRRKIPPAYLVKVGDGFVYGKQTNFVLTRSRKLLSDVSREFGMYGGKPMEESSLLKTVLKLPRPVHIKGTVAVVSTSGANNFHHWNYDCLPRFYLLQRAGLFHQIDKFIVAYSELPFQIESLRLLGIDKSRIINPDTSEDVLLQSDILYVPSLPSVLGTVSPWVVEFLDNLYNPARVSDVRFTRIYLSRKNVQSRKIINNDEFMRVLSDFNIVEVFPEDFTLAEMAKLMRGASFIISVHGSGLSNLCFIAPGTKVVDILAPYHQDAYYWMISNIRHSSYIGFFGEGAHPADDVDLVKRKIDEDLYLDLTKMRSLLQTELGHEAA